MKNAILKPVNKSPFLIVADREKDFPQKSCPREIVFLVLQELKMILIS